MGCVGGGVLVLVFGGFLGLRFLVLGLVFFGGEGGVCF